MCNNKINQKQIHVRKNYGCENENAGTAGYHYHLLKKLFLYATLNASLFIPDDQLNRTALISFSLFHMEFCPILSRTIHECCKSWCMVINVGIVSYLLCDWCLVGQIRRYTG